MPRAKRLSRSARHLAAQRALLRSPGRLLEDEIRPTAGVVTRCGKHLEVEPLFQKGESLLVARDGIKPNPGDLVLFTYSHGRRVRIVKIIGHRSEIRDVMEALLLDTLPRRGFPPRVLEEATAATKKHHVRDPGRVDLRSLYTFTIDPETARDFDDALSFEAVEGGLVRVYVHIADVSYFVQEGSAIDQEALRRGNSVYVVTGVEPMLPPQLSSGVCSLSPGIDRKAVTVELIVDESGRVKQADFYRSLIRSDERLEYEQVQQMFEGRLQPSSQLGPVLGLARPPARHHQHHLSRARLPLR